MKIYSKNSSFFGKIKEMAPLHKLLGILRILCPISLMGDKKINCSFCPTTKCEYDQKQEK
jgi:hypothetical protein